jgi:hypothetical protein
MTLAQTSSGSPGGEARWFFGPASDLLFGCGLVYGAFFAAQSVAGPTMREWLPMSLLPFLILVLGTPHYGATLLRVYEHADDRRRYALFAVHASAVLALCFVVGLHWVALGSFLVTVYFSWSPWHYAGQNYGLALLFLRKRKVPIPPITKRLLYGTFILSYALVFLVLHSEGPVVQQAPGDLEGTVYVFLNLGIPAALRDGAGLVLCAAYLACLVGAAWRLRRVPLRDLLPTGALVGMQGLWFLVPTVAGLLGGSGLVEPFDPRHRPYAFMWVAVGHFAQYLWITTFYAAGSQDRASRARYLGKALLAGVAIWTLPTLLFAPGVLGPLPHDLGLALLTASVVNLHHFVLDGAIWKLRDGRVARALLRPVEAPPPGAAARPRGGFVGRGAWLAGGVLLAVAFGRQYESVMGNRAAERGDLSRVEVALARQGWLGYATPSVHLRLARRALARDDLVAARLELSRALALYPTAEAWVLSGLLHEREGRLQQAADDYEQTLVLDPGHVAALVNSARLLERRGRPQDALERLERAAAADPGNQRVRALLESRRSRPPGSG